MAVKRGMLHGRRPAAERDVPRFTILVTGEGDPTLAMRWINGAAIEMEAGGSLKDVRASFYEEGAQTKPRVVRRPS